LKKEAYSSTSTIPGKKLEIILNFMADKKTDFPISPLNIFDKSNKIIEERS